MQKQKVHDREAPKAVMPDKSEVICPLIFKLTGLAVNYDLTWQPETKVSLVTDEGKVIEECVGVWKSNPVQRGHTQQFQDELDKMREDGSVEWKESAYYFSHAEGVDARRKYEEKVLAGEVKAHITSWGPNPSRANDKSRFHKFTGVTFEELTKRFPSLYGKTASVKPAPPVEKEEVEIIRLPEIVDALEDEPTISDLEEIKHEERVAAATTVKDAVEELVAEADDTEFDRLTLWSDESELSERIDCRREAIVYRGDDGEEIVAYAHDLPEINTTLFLPVGAWDINGVKYEVKLEN